MEYLGILLLAVTLGIGESLEQPQLEEEFSGHVHSTSKTVLDVLKERNLTEMSYLVTKADLNKTLAGKGPFTVFGVTDDGLSNLPIVIRERLVREKAFAVDFLKYHILPANVTSSQMTDGKVVKTLNGKSTCFNDYTVGGKKVILANGAKLVTVDLMAPNGIVQELQKPLWPQAVNNITELIYKHKALTNFTSYLKKSGVDLTSTGPFTVFVPSNEAFKAYSGDTGEKMINYHVVDGTYYSAGLSNKQELPTHLKKWIGYHKVTILIDNGHMSVKGKKDTAKVTTMDLAALNGVIHILDKVLTHP
ncbi:Periostin [Apostichopus japonicus]|uniref:Periostin n=1 Tax=Stichopus japonicus TaxID=307972 RepID=A0A2G8L9D6_STIJA|nr:Periostin [Apostichopus japonicus]